MQTTDLEPEYDRTSRLLSAAIVILYIVHAYFTIIYSRTPIGLPEKEMLFLRHMATGSTLWLLAGWRLWRWHKVDRHPTRAKGTPEKSMQFRRLVAYAIFVSLFVQPFLGLINAFGMGKDVILLGFIPMPELMGSSAEAKLIAGYYHSAVQFFTTFMVALYVILTLIHAEKYTGSGFGLTAKPIEFEFRTSAFNNYMPTSKYFQRGLVGLLLAYALYMPHQIFGLVPWYTNEPGHQDMATDIVWEDKALTTDEMKQIQEYVMWCTFCHTYEKGGENKTGPNLYNVYGRPVAGAPRFPYSDAFLDAKNGGVVWTDETLDKFLADQDAFMPDTNMIYKNIEDPEHRRLVIQYLKNMTN